MRADERDDLPMQRRHQFGQYERARRDVQSFAFAGAGAEQNRQVHAAEGEQHADDPKPDRHAAVEILHGDDRGQTDRADDDGTTQRHTSVQHRDVHHARRPFADGGIRTGNVGQGVGDRHRRRYRRCQHVHNVCVICGICDIHDICDMRDACDRPDHLPPPM